MGTRLDESYAGSRNGGRIRWHAHASGTFGWPFFGSGRTFLEMSSPVRKILDEIYKLPKEQRALLRAELDSLDEDDDVQNVFTNFEVSDEVMKKLTAA